MSDVSAAGVARKRLLVIADADSYVKWGVSRAVEARDSWDVDLVVVESAITPSTEQLAAAIDGRWPTPVNPRPFRDVVAQLSSNPPDAVLFACRGPLIDLLVRAAFKKAFTHVRPRPALAAGIPGVWLPPTELGVQYRVAMDLMVLHSKRERAAVQQLVQDLGAGPEHAGLASLSPGDGEPRPGDRKVVFAPQALVPARLGARKRLLAGLVATARRHPDTQVIIKERGRPGESQTHRDKANFTELLAQLDDVPPNLTVGYGPMREHLEGSSGFVTVSSTAALEAIAAGVPTLCLDDFGVNVENINVVFEGSGLLGSLADLEALQFREPQGDWLRDNYFHDRADDDWLVQLEVLSLAGGDSQLPRLTAGALGHAALPQFWRGRWMALGKADWGPMRWLGSRTAQAYDWVKRLRKRALRAVGR